MIYVALVILGLILGSFVNALVWRLHENKARSLWKGRSMCVHCHHTLAPRDLIPVVSWLILKGQCRYCHKAISWQYPAVELLAAVLVVASYIWWPAAITGTELIRFICWQGLLTGFVALLVYDLRWLTLPNAIIYPLILLVINQWVIIGFINGWSAGFLRDIGLSALVGGGVFYLLFQLSQGKWIGGGDVKLGFLLGLVVADPLYSWLLLFLASALGVVITVPLLATGKTTRQTKVPFGPFLLAAGFMVVLFGEAITTWLERLLLIS